MVITIATASFGAHQLESRVKDEEMITSGSDFFACGYKVRMPNIQKHVDGGRSNTPSTARPSPRIKNTHSLRSQARDSGRRVNELSKLLSFTDDVVSHRNPVCISYTKARESTRTLFKPEDLEMGIGAHLKKTKGIVGRHDCRGEPKRHVPCHLQPDDHISHLEGTQYGSIGLSGQSRRDLILERNSHNRLHVKDDHFLGRVRSVAPSKSIPWQEQTLEKVSSSTARHLTGQPSKDNFDDNLHVRPLTHKRSHQRRHHSMAISDSEFGDEKDVTHFDTTLMDDLPPPKNFISELQAGARPVHQCAGDGNTILLSNNARFNKVLQPSYPHSPSQWQERSKTGGLAEALHVGGEGEEEEEEEGAHVRGYRRWSDFPQRAKTPEDLQWECRSLDTALEGEESKESCFSEMSSKRAIKNKELFDIMQEWCSKWQIHVQLGDLRGEDSILDGLHNLCDNTKMFAIASVAQLARRHAIAKAKSSKSRSSLLLSLSQSRSNASSVNCPLIEVSDEMLEAVERLLDDGTEHVRVPAAIMLYCMDRQSEKAEEVLLSTITSGIGPAERWASVQVLVYARVVPAPVISELLHHLHDSQQHQSGRRERVADLLARSSAFTPLVHAMIAEQLNSSGWQERLAACQMLPRLHRGINKDLQFKLVVLSWEDWSPEVRQAAAIALGLTGHAKMIHDEIANRLTNPEEAVRLDALKKLHNLHLMTPHLLPSFLKCFNDDHISVKIESIALAGSLKLSEPQVFQALQNLLQDPCWKVKAHALRAFADIGVADDELVSKLLWAVRFEKLPAVRAEACHTIASLQLKQERVVKTLQDLLNVDDEPLVLREVSLTLQQLGCSLEGEDDMLEKIRSEVKRRGTQKSITLEIIEADMNDTTDYVIRRPRIAMTTRDYLNDKHRNDVFSDTHMKTSVHSRSSQKPSHKRRRSLQEHYSTSTASTNSMPLPHGLQRDSSDRTRTVSLSGGRSLRQWSPDRKTIDAQLNEMKKRVSMDVSVLD